MPSTPTAASLRSRAKAPASSSTSIRWASEWNLPAGSRFALSATLRSSVDMSSDVEASVMLPSASSHQHGPPLLARVRVPCVPRGHSSYSALRLPALLRLRTLVPLVRTYLARSLVLDRQGLPDDWSILLSTRHGRTPRRLRRLLDLSNGHSAAAFGHHDALGTRNDGNYEAAFPRLTLSRTYVSLRQLPAASQGSLPACGSTLWPDGIRTRWTDTPNFRTSPTTSLPSDQP